MLRLFLVAFAVGAGLMIASARPKQHILNEAIDIYDDGTPPLGMAPYLELGLTVGGLGVVYRF